MNEQTVIPMSQQYMNEYPLESNNMHADESARASMKTQNKEKTELANNFNDLDLRNINSVNKHLYLMNMNNNPHSINDPSIQETLSPYFQPFGVDVSHLPMTNPPIFQNSVATHDEPFPRRRISISNGQISQLGDDIETVENLYNTQPPPLPLKQTYQQPDGSWNIAQPTHASQYQQLLRKQQYQIPPQNTNNHIPVTAPGQLEPQTFQDSRVKQEYLNLLSANGIPQHHSSSSNYEENSMIEPLPGTSAWKRARLLERNRIAASKCRQRKKVAQIQLQTDFDILSKDNSILVKKVVYYEKLISKFKKFTESHFNTCHKTNNGVIDDDKTALKIIQEMLMIEEDIVEVNENGKIIKSDIDNITSQDSPINYETNL